PISDANQRLQAGAGLARSQHLVKDNCGRGRLLQFQLGQGERVANVEIRLQLQSRLQRIRSGLKVSLQKINLSGEIQGADVTRILLKNSLSFSSGCGKITGLKFGDSQINE